MRCHVFGEEIRKANHLKLLSSPVHYQQYVKPLISIYICQNHFAAAQVIVVQSTNDEQLVSVVLFRNCCWTGVYFNIQISRR